MGFFSESDEDIQRKRTKEFVQQKGGVVNAIDPKDYQLLALHQNEAIIQLLGGVLSSHGIGGVASANLVIGVYYDKVKELMK